MSRRVWNQISEDIRIKGLRSSLAMEPFDQIFENLSLDVNGQCSPQVVGPRADLDQKLEGT